MGLKDGKTAESLGSVERSELHKTAEMEMEGGLSTCEWSLCVPLSVSFCTGLRSAGDMQECTRVGKRQESVTMRMT